MSAETAGHRFLGDDLKKSAIITFCFYIIAFVLFSALVFGTTLRLKLKYIQCESLAACCALFFVSVFVLLRTSDVFRNRRAVWLALVPSVFFCGAYTVLCFFSLKSTFVLYYYTGTLIFPFLLLISHLLMRGLQPLFIRGLLRALYFCVVFFSILFTTIYCFYFGTYRSEFDDVSFLSVVATTRTEAAEYMRTTFTVPELAVMGLLVLLFIGLALTMTAAVHAGSRMKSLPPGGKGDWASCLLVCLFAFLFSFKLSYFPLDVYRHAHKKGGVLAQIFVDLAKNMQDCDVSLLVKASETAAAKVPGTILVVIGESETRDHMKVFNRNHLTDTTPWEAKAAAEGDIVLFGKAYSNYPNTPMALTQALTGANQYNGIELKNADDVIGLARAAGYRTFWISNQNHSDVYDAACIFARTSDKQYSLKSYDERLLQYLRFVPREQNNFVIVHMQGSHYSYRERVPEKFYRENVRGTGTEAEYDCTVAYTDYVLEKIFSYARENLNLQAMIYFSDHGENMKYRHIADPLKFDMLRIPLWVYLSPQYKKIYPDTAHQLRANSGRVFTNDLVFELISGILHASSKGYQAAFDISSSQYALTPENARSVRGRISVSADRNYDDYGRPGAAKAEDGSPEKAGIAAANDNPG